MSEVRIITSGRGGGADYEGELTPSRPGEVDMVQTVHRSTDSLDDDGYEYHVFRVRVRRRVIHAAGCERERVASGELVRCAGECLAR